MTKPKAAASGKKGGAVVLAIAVDQARRALEDPETRQKIAEQGRAMASYVKTWNEGRSERRSERSTDEEGAPRRGVPERITDQFGQGKLERRVANLRSSIAA